MKYIDKKTKKLGFVQSKLITGHKTIGSNVMATQSRLYISRIQDKKAPFSKTRIEKRKTIPIWHIKYNDNSE